MQICQELIDLGMTLARAATDRALQDMAAAPPSTPIPCSSAAAIEQAEERARHRTPDYGRLFTHLSRAVRQTILLQAHIADGRTHAQHADARPPAPHNHLARPRPAPDNDLDADQPCETLQREAAERLDRIAAGQRDEIEVEHLLEEIGRKFGQHPGPASNTANPSGNKTGPNQSDPPNPAPPTPSPGARPRQTAIRRPDRR